MKRSTTIIIILIIIIAVYYGLRKNNTANTAPAATDTTTQTTVNTPTTQATDQVSIIDSSFSPSTVTVAVGSTVTWTNNDTMAHSVVVDGVVSPTLQTGQTFTHTFSVSGSFDYHCGIHPSMTGSVIVQ